MKNKRRSKTARRKDRADRFDEKLNLNAAGIDIGSESHWVAVPPDRTDEPVRRFRSFTHDLRQLADWLTACGIDTVCMESTGIYWIPLYELLEDRGFKVCLVNARHVKNVPGRKTDVLDCQWLRKLHTYGLLRASFRPDQEIVKLRAYVRHRDNLVQYAANHIQHMQKALFLMSVHLPKVVTDITGRTGMAIVRDIVSGKHDPQALAEHRDPRCKSSRKQIADALTGNYQPEHIFVLDQALQSYNHYQQMIHKTDQAIESLVDTLAARSPVREDPLPAPRTKTKPRANEPLFEVRSPLYAITGADLTQIDGIGPYSALRLLSEIGHDMNRWPSEGHFSSWLALAPGSRISGGKLLGSRTPCSANRAATLFRMSAMSVGRTQTSLGAFYRRLAGRIGKAKAVTATARKIAVMVYRVLKHGLHYRDPGADHYERHYRAKVVTGLCRRAKKLGFQLVPIQNDPPPTATPAAAVS